MSTAIYQITNVVTYKRYIGSAVNHATRWQLHKQQLNSKTHHSFLLQKAWNKHGKENFKFEIIELCEKSRLVEREQYYFDLLQPEYNVCKIAGSAIGRTPWNKGIKTGPRSEETKLKQSLSQKGQNSYWYGRKHTEKSREKMSKIHKGQIPWNKSREKTQ